MLQKFAELGFDLITTLALDGLDDSEDSNPKLQFEEICHKVEADFLKKFPSYKKRNKQGADFLAKQANFDVLAEWIFIQHLEGNPDLDRLNDDGTEATDGEIDYLLQRFKHHISNNHYFNTYLSYIHSQNISRTIREFIDNQSQQKIVQNAASMELLESYAPPTPGFLGRQADLAEIDRKFKAGESIVVICGQGGMGKSELAKEYCRIHRDDYDMVCFAYYKGSVAATVTDGLLWNPGDWNEMPPAEQFAAKRGYINSLDNRVLLIFDDVTEMDDYADLLKICGRNVDVLITTRAEKLIDARPVMLGRLGYEDGLLPLFRHNAEIPEGEWAGWYRVNEAAVKEIIQDILLGHTMLVILAARLLAATDRTVEDIRNSLKNSRLSPEIKEKIRSYKDSGRENCSAADATLCEHVLSLYSISALAGDESKISILRNMSLIPYSGVKRATLQEWLELEDLNDVNELIDNGWLTLSTVAGEKRVAMHAVISDAVYIQTEPTAEKCSTLLISIANEMYLDGAYDNPVDKVHMIEYGEFALKRIKQEETTVAQIAHQIGYLLDFRAEYDRGLEWYIRALEINEKVLGKEHPTTATTYNNIALVCCNQGDYAKALKWLLRALAIREKVLGKEHPDTATTYNNIAAVYDNQGDYAKALKWYLRALAIREKILGKEHPSTATTYNNIAVVYDNQGDYTKALKWYLKALTIREKVLGKEHPDTATTYNNIALVYSRQGDNAKALEWHLKALAIREKLLGKEHPDTATTYNNIGILYANQEDYAETLIWLDKALEVRENKLGREHPYTVGTREDIVEVKRRMGGERE